jgi:hypothetical protein
MTASSKELTGHRKSSIHTRFDEQNFMHRLCTNGLGCNNLGMEISICSMGTPTLTKAELSALLFEQLGLNKREARDFVDAFFETMLAQLAPGQDSIGTPEIQYKNCIDAIKMLKNENRTLKVWMGKNV